MQKPGNKIKPSNVPLFPAVTLSKQRFLNDSLGGRPVYKLPPSHLEVQKWFQNVDSKVSTGKLTAKDLQMAFFTFQGRLFSDATCKFVVRLFDLDKNGGLDIEEFESLYYHIKIWVNAFKTHDRTRNGFLDDKDMLEALKYMEINVSPEFVRFLVTKHDPVNRKITLDQFITVCVHIQKFGEDFLAMDEEKTGVISLRYENFLELMLKCI